MSFRIVGDLCQWYVLSVSPSSVTEVITAGGARPAPQSALWARPPPLSSPNNGPTTQALVAEAPPAHPPSQRAACQPAEHVGTPGDFTKARTPCHCLCLPLSHAQRVASGLVIFPTLRADGPAAVEEARGTQPPESGRTRCPPMCWPRPSWSSP